MAKPVKCSCGGEVEKVKENTTIRCTVCGKVAVVTATATKKGMSSMSIYMTLGLFRAIRECQKSGTLSWVEP